MSRAIARLAALMLLCAGAAATLAQDRVYRCGADGRSYSQEPCEGGRPVDVTDSRTAQQAAQTRQAASRDAREANELERQRLHAERLAVRQGPSLIGWSAKPAQPDGSRCVAGKSCARGEAPKRRSDKTHTVTQYRAAETR